MRFLLTVARESEAKIAADDLGGIAPGRHRDAGARVTAGAAEIKGYGSASGRNQTGDRPHGADLIGQEGTMLVRAVHRANDAALIVEWR